MFKRSKYGNKKITADGHTFDSKKEYKRYCELKLLQRGNKISSIELQPKFILQEGFRDKERKAHRAITYSADFKYIKDGETIIEDVKASAYFKDDVYRIKKKLLLFKYKDINFVEIY